MIKKLFIIFKTNKYKIIIDSNKLMAFSPNISIIKTQDMYKTILLYLEYNM